MNPEFERLEYGENEDTGLRDPWWKEIWPQDVTGKTQVLDHNAQRKTNAANSDYAEGWTKLVDSTTGQEWTSGNLNTPMYYNLPSPFLPSPSQIDAAAYKIAKMLIQEQYCQSGSAESFFLLVEDIKKAL